MGAYSVVTRRQFPVFLSLDTPESVLNAAVTGLSSSMSEHGLSGLDDFWVTGRSKTANEGSVPFGVISNETAGRCWRRLAKVWLAR